jgi:hypothetical protein
LASVTPSRDQPLLNAIELINCRQLSYGPLGHSAGATERARRLSPLDTFPAACDPWGLDLVAG